MNIAAERAYTTPLANSTLLPMLILSLMRQKNAPNTAKTFNAEYDYIVVGAGSAGSVVASRLSEMPCVSILLIEAGKSPPYITEVPGIAPYLWGSDLDWNYRTVPQRYTGRLLNNRQIQLASGKMLGGSSALNSMAYVRGNRNNYDDWAAEGAKGWSYKDIFPYFLKMEDNMDPEFVANGYHGVGGPLTVQRPWYQSEIMEPIFKASKAIGYDIVDSNAARQTGLSDFQSTLRGGQRCSTAKAYLVPAENRNNLDILTNATVLKLLIKNRRAVGVHFDFQGKTYVVKARREVILSAGTVNSAKLLMLSGIGPRKELLRNKIPIVANLPVGQNLQDHFAMGVNFELNPNVESVESKLSNPSNIIQYIQNRSGPLGSTQLLAAILWGNGDLVRPMGDFPTFFLAFEEGLALRDGILPEADEQIYGPYEGKPFYGCICSLLQPRSRGTVTLNSSDPYDPPLIDPNYLEDPRDIDDIVDGLKLCSRIGNSAELRSLGSIPFQTIYPGCEPFVGDEDAYLRCTITSAGFGFFHLVGTVRMGNLNDPRTVVDPQLRVKHVKGLRVVDASVMPIVPSGPINVPTIAVAEKASDIIKASIQCNGYEMGGEWWHVSDDCGWINQRHYVPRRDLETDVPFDIYK